MCRKKKHFLFLWNIFMLWGLQIQNCTWHKKNVLTIIGMLMKIEDCQIRGQDSRNLLCWKRHLHKEKCGERLTEIQTTTRPDHFWPEAWSRIGKAAQKKNKNGQLRKRNSKMPGICDIDPDDEEHKDIIKNARKNGNINGWCHAMQKIHELTGNRSSEHYKSPNIWEDSRDEIRWYCGSAWIHMTKNGICHEEKSWRPHCRQKTKFNISLQLGAQIFLIPQVMKIPDAMAAVDKEWKKLETLLAWQLEKVRSKKEVNKRGTEKQK